MKNYKVQLIRRWSDQNQSTGILLVINENGQPVYAAPCIERGDRNNEKNVSRVPAGIYPLIYEYSPKFDRKLWELKDVPGRSECKIHPSNYWDQLNGCIAPGVFLKDLNKDGYYDVTSSTTATGNLHKTLQGIKQTTIEIIDEI